MRFLMMALLWGCCSSLWASERNDSFSTNIYIAEWSQLRHRAQTGDAVAQFQLGNVYYAPPERSGIAQSYRKAFTFYVQAALRGYAKAQHNVGAMFLNGDYVTQNPVEALAWFHLAAINGDKSGKRKYEEFLPSLTEYGRDMSRKRAVELQKQMEEVQRVRDFRASRVGLDLSETFD